MSRVLTFSRYFPGYHPRKGWPTHFVEKIWKWYYDQHNGDVRDLLWYNEQYDNFFGVDAILNVHNFQPKNHTIRAGHHWKAGDKFKPVTWLLPGGRFTPGNKQIVIAPDMEVKQTWDFKIVEYPNGVGTHLEIAGSFCHSQSYTEVCSETLTRCAKNDGLETQDFLDWFRFPKPFDGQIICWNENIQY